MTKRLRPRTLTSARRPWLGLLLLLALSLTALAVANGPVPASPETLTRTVAGWGDDGSDEEDPDAPFSISGSASDLNVYAMSCFDTGGEFFTFSAEAYASTTANRSAYYLAADVKLYANSLLRGQAFEERYGPVSAVSASTSYSAPCQEYEEYSLLARGWHKGIETAGGTAQYETSSDR